jgi:glycosyltransferase involved in cell wall biosynthesis
VRVGWVIYGALDQATGGYIYDRLVIERLAARGDEVRLFELDQRPGVDSVVALAAGIARADPDVIVGDELCHREIAIAFPVLPRRIARALLVHHLGAWELSPGPRRAPLLRSETAAIQASDVVIATSRTTAERLRRELGVGGVELAEAGADRLEVLPRLASSDRVRLVFVGSLIPRKRVLELLSALDRALDPRLELSLIGDTERDRPYAARVLAAIEASPFLRERVTRRGRLSDGELAAALAEADALVLPSSLEGYGVVLTEAIRAGVPVIAARFGAAVVRDGAEALLFDSESELVDLLRRFAGDADLRARMRAAAQARAPSLPTWGATGDAVRAALSRAVLLVNERRRTR